MKRITVTLGNELESALKAYASRQAIPPKLTSVVQAALREYLARRSFASPGRPLRIAPARRGSGKADVSRKHDKYFAQNA